MKNYSSLEHALARARIYLEDAQETQNEDVLRGQLYALKEVLQEADRLVDKRLDDLNNPSFPVEPMRFYSSEK